MLKNLFELIALKGNGDGKTLGTDRCSRLGPGATSWNFHYLIFVCSPAISLPLYKVLTINMVFKYLLPNTDKQPLFCLKCSKRIVSPSCTICLSWWRNCLEASSHIFTHLLIEHNMQQQEWLFTLYTISINFLFRALQRLWRGIIYNLLSTNNIHIYSSQWWMFILLIMIQRWRRFFVSF